VGRQDETAQSVCHETNEVLGEQTINYSTVTQHLCLVRFEDVPLHARHTRHMNVVDRAILTAPVTSPFSSIRQLGRLTSFSGTTVCRHLMERFDCEACSLNAPMLSLIVKCTSGRMVTPARQCRQITITIVEYLMSPAFLLGLTGTRSCSSPVGSLLKD
jgi:hypothetical protein